MFKNTASFIALLCVTLVSLALSAQEKPYSPKAASPSSLLKSATYRDSPLALEFQQTNYRTVTNRKRLDFEHTYAVSYGELVNYMVTAFEEQKIVMKLDPKFAPHLANHDIFVMGISPGGSKARFTLGSKFVPLRFVIDVEPGNGDESIVTVHNAIFSQLFSGIMPARTGYKPNQGKEVPFRWN